MKELIIALIIVTVLLMGLVVVTAPPAQSIDTTTVNATTLPSTRNMPVVTSPPRRLANANAVTLRPPVGQTMVQMFDTLAADAEVIARLNGGTHCTKLGEATDVAEEGISMSFYKLECNGRTGYVNVKWVQTGQ